MRLIAQTEDKIVDLDVTPYRGNGFISDEELGMLIDTTLIASKLKQLEGVIAITENYVQLSAKAFHEIKLCNQVDDLKVSVCGQDIHADFWLGGCRFTTIL